MKLYLGLSFLSKNNRSQIKSSKASFPRAGTVDTGTIYHTLLVLTLYTRLLSLSVQAQFKTRSVAEARRRRNRMIQPIDVDESLVPAADIGWQMTAIF